MPATVVHSFSIHRAGQAATLRASVWSLVIHASVGFRVAYRAIPQSLMEKLEALNGGRQSAITGHYRLCRNFLLGTLPDDRFTATNLNPGLARPGHDLPFEMPQKLQSLNSDGWPVYGEQIETGSASTRP